MIKKHVFIINPNAGKKNALDLWAYIEANYSEAKIVVTQFKGHAVEIAATYAGKDTAIYAVGGDGTLNEVINGVMKSPYCRDTLIGVVPYGSGNDFIKSLTTIKNPIKLLERYQEERSRLVDVGRMNDRYFINIGSIGFDAKIVHNARKFKNIPMIRGELAYIISVLTTLVHLQSYEVVMKIDHNRGIKKNILMMIIANGRFYGGGMVPAPEAILWDGYLDFCRVDAISRGKVIQLLPKFIKGKHTSLEAVTMGKGKKLSLESKVLMPVNLDGEILWGKHFRLAINEKTVSILLP